MAYRRGRYEPAEDRGDDNPPRRPRRRSPSPESQVAPPTTGRTFQSLRDAISSEFTPSGDAGMDRENLMEIILLHFSYLGSRDFLGRAWNEFTERTPEIFGDDDILDNNRRMVNAILQNANTIDTGFEEFANQLIEDGEGDIESDQEDDSDALLSEDSYEGNGRRMCGCGHRMYSSK